MAPPMQVVTPFIYTAHLAGPQGQFFSGWTVPKHKEIGASAGSDYKCIAGNPVWVVIYIETSFLIWQRSYLEPVFSLPCWCRHISFGGGIGLAGEFGLIECNSAEWSFNSKSLAPYANIMWPKLAYIQQLYRYFGILWRLYFLEIWVFIKSTLATSPSTNCQKFQGLGFLLFLVAACLAWHKAKAQPVIPGWKCTSEKTSWD